MLYPNQRFFCLLASLSAFFLSACILYPKYKRPCMEMPQEWRTPSEDSSTISNTRWWQEFKDPVLDALIDEALASNLDLQLATARISEFQARLGIVSSQLYPQIYAQGTALRQRFSTTAPGQGTAVPGAPLAGAGEGAGECACLTGLFPSISPYFNDYLTILTASYQVDLWGKIRSATNASRAELFSQIEARRTVILTLVAAVASEYILLRQYDQQLVISINTLKSRQQSFELARIRYEEGLTSQLEVRQAESDRDEASIQVIKYQTLIPMQENLISVLIGHPPQSIQRGLRIYEWDLPPCIPAGLPIDLLEQRPDIVQAEEALKASNFRIGEARALFFPDLTLTGFYGYESGKLHELFINPSRTWQWLADLLQPIFTGGRLVSNLDLAKAQNQEALVQYLQVILQALKEVDNSLIAHRRSKESFKVQNARVEVLKEYLRLARLQYNNGLVDYLNVLDAERRLFAAQLDLAREQSNIFLTLVDIYKALGGGWVIDAEGELGQ